MVQNILGAIGCALNGISGIILASTFGFAAFPSALIFLIGGIGMLVFGQVSPLLLQTELVVLAGSFGRNRQERLAVCMFAGIITAVLGVTGAIGSVVSFIGDDILYGIMAGVGIMLTSVSIKMVKDNFKLGSISMAAGIITYLLTSNIIYTTVAAIAIPGVIWNIVHRAEVKAAPPADFSLEQFKLNRFRFHPSMIRGILAITTLLLGGIISGAAINASLAGSTADFNAVTVYAGLATALSPLFGGAPAGVVVVGTASAPDPLLSGIILMAVMAAAMLTKLAPRLKRVLPTECVAGLLFVLGAFVIFPDNAAASLQMSPLIGGTTMLIAAMVDPFVGMCAGVLMRYILILV